MFERTALPEGPRVISARLPGARSVSMAAYVLAGSRLESAEEAGVAHFMEHITFKGTRGLPDDPRHLSEAIEGVGGSFNAATDRESTVYWVRVPRREARRAMDVLGELIVRPILDDRRDRPRAHGDRRGDPLLPGRSRPSTPRPCSRQAMFGDGPLGREICGDEAGIHALPEPTIRDFWRTMYRPANTVVAVAGDIAHDEAVELVATRVRDRQRRRSRASRRRRPCRPGERVRLGRPPDAPRPSSWSACRPCAATTPTPGRWPS